MKKTRTFTLSAALLLASITPALANDVKPVQEEAIAVQENFIKLTGTITHVENRTDGLQSVLIEEQDTIFHMTINEKTKIYDNTGKAVEIKEGLSFTAYVDAHKPMIMIYPPQYTPELIIIQTEQMGNVTVATFDEQLSNDTLKLNVDKKTVIEDLDGKKLTKQDIIDKDVAVFYDKTTRSIPAQTTPSKIILLTNAQKEIQAMIDGDYHDVNGITMVPLRVIAEKLGWTVKSTGKGATLSRGNASYTITRGQKEYGYNRSIRTFEEAPALLEANKTYVPLSFIEGLY